MRNRYTYTVSAPIEEAVAAYKTTEFFIATLKHAGAVTIEILEEKPLPGEGRYWKAKISESSRVPEVLRASDLDIYINESAFNPPERKLSWQIRPNFSTGRLSLTGDISLFEEGTNTTRLVYDVSLEVKIPFIGSTAETFGLRKIGEEFRSQAAFLNHWLNRKKGSDA